MAYTTYGNSAATSSTLQGRLVARLEAARENWGKWRVYRKTVNELSALSDRDLNDLGLSRSMIRGIALEAAYGK